MSGPVLAGLFAGAVFLAGLALGRWLWRPRCPAAKVERTWVLARHQGQVALELRHTLWRPSAHGEQQGCFAATTFRLPLALARPCWRSASRTGICWPKRLKATSALSPHERRACTC